MLFFPENIGELTRRPFIYFTCDDASRSASIALPMPPSMNFGDEATYNNTELGIIGNAVSSLAGQISRGAGEGAIVGSATDSIKKAYNQSNVGSIIRGISAISGAPEGLQSAISIGTGTTLNKNITTEFTSVNTRRFSFAFQLIARSSSENNMIKGIVRAFRTGVYPEGNDFQLRYPPKWNIRFMKGGTEGGKIIDDIPEIGQVFLESVSTTYNSSGNMWRTDGSPLETMVTVTFIETKAYTIESLPGTTDYRGVTPYQAPSDASLEAARRRIQGQ
jgi:hypothetical protein